LPQSNQLLQPLHAQCTTVLSCYWLVALHAIATVHFIPEREASNKSTVLHLSLTDSKATQIVHKDYNVLCKLDQWRYRVCEPTETAGEQQLQAREGPTRRVQWWKLRSCKLC